MPRAVVLGGGLSGIAAALTLAQAGWRSVTVVERGSRLGGLAGSFERHDKFYPLGYHHILHRDRVLLYFLDQIGALGSVRWKRIRMLFETRDGLLDLGNPIDFLKFPLSPLNKLRLGRLMLRAYGNRDWSAWHDRSAEDLLDRWGSAKIRETLFEPLTQLKFGLPCAEVSGAWMGARLYFREGSAPLGYIPGANWTTILCDRLTDLVRSQGLSVIVDASVDAIRADGDRVTAVTLSDGRSLDADVFVSTVPTPVYSRLAPTDRTGQIGQIRYTALLSVVSATLQPVAPDFYWLNLTSLRHSACGIFVLNSLNDTIGGRGETCLNFVTHLPSSSDPFFRLPDRELIESYSADLKAVLGVPLDPLWVHVARVPMYSPVFVRGYRNPPVKSERFENLYFAGNYRTFPSVASTGTALHSGLVTGRAILRAHGQDTDLEEKASSFRLRNMPRG
jgi:protoporphyrinogen oxidase